MLSNSKTLKGVSTAMDWSAFLLLILGAIGGIIAALAAGLKNVIIAWMERWVRTVRQGMAIRLSVIGDYIESIEDIKKIGNVDRVIVFSGKNGGGLPTPGKPFVIRAQTGWSRKAGADPMRRYNFDIPIDSFYSRMLETLVKDGQYELNTATIPQDARLRTYYLAEGVTHSIMYFLRIIDNELIYMSVASYDRPFSNDERIEVDLAVERVRSVMREH